MVSHKFDKQTANMAGVWQEYGRINTSIVVTNSEIWVRYIDKH